MDTPWLIGAAAVDITPEPGTHLAGLGMGTHRPAETVLDPLYARALVVEGGGCQVCLVTLDLLAVAEPASRAIRQGASAWGFAEEAVIVHAMQNHSSPSAGRMMMDADFPMPSAPELEFLGGSESAYVERAVAGAIEAIGKAVARKAPAGLQLGRAVNDRLAHNRRGIRRDGSISMPWFFRREDMPLGPTDLLRLEGPSDAEVGLACLTAPNGTVRSSLLHHTCHPVNMFALNKRTVTADWPGAWIQALKRHGLADCCPLVVNGCCGNINPWPPFEADFVPDHQRMGSALAAETAATLDHVTASTTDAVGWRQRVVELDYRDVPAERLAEAEALLKAQPEPPRGPDGEVEASWFAAASTWSTELCRRRWPRFPYEIQAFRLGDLALVALPGEPFVEGQLELKLRSPAPYTFVAHMSTHYVGYIPTAEACARGGHEASRNYPYWAKLAPDSLARIVDNAVEMLEELYR